MKAKGYFTKLIQLILVCLVCLVESGSSGCLSCLSGSQSQCVSEVCDGVFHPAGLESSD